MNSLPESLHSDVAFLSQKTKVLRCSQGARAHVLHEYLGGGRVHWEWKERGRPDSRKRFSICRSQAPGREPMIWNTAVVFNGEIAWGCKYLVDGENRVYNPPSVFVILHFL